MDVVVFAAVSVVVEQFDADGDDDDDDVAAAAEAVSFGLVDVIEPNVPAVNETD